RTLERASPLKPPRREPARRLLRARSQTWFRPCCSWPSSHHRCRRPPTRARPEYGRDRGGGLCLRRDAVRERLSIGLGRRADAAARAARSLLHQEQGGGVEERRRRSLVGELSSCPTAVPIQPDMRNSAGIAHGEREVVVAGVG